MLLVCYNIIFLRYWDFFQKSLTLKCFRETLASFLPLEMQAHIAAAGERSPEKEKEEEEDR